jgi:peroxiredoxin
VSHTSLQAELDAMTARTRELVPPERLLPNEHAVAHLLTLGLEQRMLGPGAHAPSFALEDYTGKLVRSADLLALGPVVVTFFRGRWCPYCIGELVAWQALYAAVRACGALLVGISPQTTRQNSFAAEHHALRFPLLADVGLRVAEQFGLAYQVPPEHQRYLRSILVNVPHVNGDGSWRLPLPATYVLAPDGTVAWARGYADWRVRPEPEEALLALQNVAEQRAGV